MGAFTEALAARRVDPHGRTWVYVPCDQLGLFGPLDMEPRDLGIVLVEDPGKAARRPYHKQKLAYVLANGRHFALEQAARGVAVRFEVAGDGLASALGRVAQELGPLVVMEPAERELREDLHPLVTGGALRVVPHAGWLTTPEDFARACPRAPWRMDAFYRTVRSRSGILMEDGNPVGGRWSFDAENRRPWRGLPPAAVPPRFTPDAITREVGDLIEARFAHHPGSLDLGALPATDADAEVLWDWALRGCLPQFGPYEDAFSHRSRTLFHTRIAPLLNLHRLLPARVISDALAADVPLPSKEGFVRQILGWREFVRHVHRATDGLRALPRHTSIAPSRIDASGAASPSFLGADNPLPPTFWGSAPSGLACLDATIGSVWAEGYTHHIPRLMVLSNLATLLDISPRALTDWFWVAFTDAYDWVVEPNVLGMGTFATGELMSTKPYVAGSAYLARMGDHCERCTFRPDADCPITPLYWAFLRRHAEALRHNPRIAGPVASALARAPGRAAEDMRVHRYVLDTLARGDALEPASVARIRSGQASDPGEMP